MSTFKAAVQALDAYLQAGFTTLPVYNDPTVRVDPEASANAAGWVELEHEFGEQGPVGGRFGNATYYNSPGVMTATVYTPREIGDGSTWSAADAIAALLREKTIGDCTVRTVRPVPAPLDDTDTHHAIHVVITFELEAYV